MSTRLIGGVIMTHGDDDGLRLPPKIAPRQIVIVPMLRDKPEDKELLDYCSSLEKELKAAGIRVLRRLEAGEVGREALELGASWRAGDRRDRRTRCCRRKRHVHAPRCAARRRQDRSHTSPRAEFVAGTQALLDGIQARLFAEAKARLDDNIVYRIKTFDELVEYFGAPEVDDEGGAFKGWAYVPWSKPQGSQAGSDCGTAKSA